MSCCKRHLASMETAGLVCCWSAMSCRNDNENCPTDLRVSTYTGTKLTNRKVDEKSVCMEVRALHGMQISSLASRGACIQSASSRAFQRGPETGLVGKLWKPSTGGRSASAAGRFRLPPEAVMTFPTVLVQTQRHQGVLNHARGGP